MTKHKSGKTIEMNRNTEIHSVEIKFCITEMFSSFCDKAYILETPITRSGIRHNAYLNKKLAASKAYSIPPARCRSKPCKLVKNIFSALNFFMHIFNMSVTYLPCIKRTH